MVSKIMDMARVRKRYWTTASLLMALLLLLSSCAGLSGSREFAGASPSVSAAPSKGTAEVARKAAEQKTAAAPTKAPADQKSAKSSKKAASDKSVQVPESEAAFAYLLVNKSNRLPQGYKPDDLVYPDVRFLFSERIEKRMLRKPAADALEMLFAAAEHDGVPLAGVSAYRSHKRQQQVFDYYVRRDGKAKALTFSAYPGTSEHETGLAVDVSGANGRCAASDCFAGTREAKWLAKHAHEYGYIVRYPKRKEGITGYKYEPWHIRYVGRTAAGHIYSQGITLEEYEETVKVSGFRHAGS